MSEQTLTVNGRTAGEKKKIVLPSRPKKRLFIGMLLLVTCLAALLLFGIWYIGVPGLERIQPALPWVIGGALTLAVLLSFFGIFNMVLAIAGLPYLPWMKRQTYELINLLFPAAVRLGAVFGIKRRKLEGSFIAVSNLLFHRMHIRVPANRHAALPAACELPAQGDARPK